MDTVCGHHGHNMRSSWTQYAVILDTICGHIIKFGNRGRQKITGIVGDKRLRESWGTTDYENRRRQKITSYKLERNLRCQRSYVCHFIHWQSVSSLKIKATADHFWVDLYGPEYTRVLFEWRMLRINNMFRSLVFFLSVSVHNNLDSAYLFICFYPILSDIGKSKSVYGFKQ